MSNSDELLSKGFQLGVETASHVYEGTRTAATKQDLEAMERRIMAKVSDALNDLKTVKEQLVKAKAEILAKIDALIAASGDRELTPEEETARTELKSAAQALDDVGDPNV